jgi:hypothetical protein
MFTSREDTEQRKVSDIPNTNPKTGSVKGKEHFRTKVNLIKRQCIEVIPPMA